MYTKFTSRCASVLNDKALFEVKIILEALYEKARGASDIVVATKLPRYRVLAYVQLLEAFGFIERIYSKGTYRVYSLTDLGKRLLEVLRKGLDFKINVVVEENIASEASVGESVDRVVSEGVVEAS